MNTVQECKNIRIKEGKEYMDADASISLKPKSRKEKDTPEILARKAALAEFEEMWRAAYECHFNEKYATLDWGRGRKGINSLLSQGVTPGQLMEVATAAWGHAAKNQSAFYTEKARTIAGLAENYLNIKSELERPAKSSPFQRTESRGALEMTIERLTREHRQLKDKAQYIQGYDPIWDQIKAVEQEIQAAKDKLKKIS